MRATDDGVDQGSTSDGKAISCSRIAANAKVGPADRDVRKRADPAAEQHSEGEALRDRRR